MEGPGSDVPSDSGPTKYCEYTELPRDQCDHCKNWRDKNHRTYRRYKGRPATFTGGDCFLCGETIVRGDMISLSEEGWVHEDCR